MEKLIREMEISCVDLIDLWTNQNINQEMSRDFNQEGDIAYEIPSSE